MNILVVYDGTLHAKKALLYGLKKVQEAGGEITVLAGIRSAAVH